MYFSFINNRSYNNKLYGLMITHLDNELYCSMITLNGSCNLVPRVSHLPALAHPRGRCDERPWKWGCFFTVLQLYDPKKLDNELYSSTVTHLYTTNITQESKIYTKLKYAVVLTYWIKLRNIVYTCLTNVLKESKKNKRLVWIYILVSISTLVRLHILLPFRTLVRLIQFYFASGL